MKTPIIFFTLLFMVVSGKGAQDFPRVRLSLQRCVDGKKWLFELDGLKVSTLPTWHPESDSPAPVTLKKASEIGRATLKARYPEIDELEVTSVSINEMASTKRLGSWFYVLSYAGKRDGKSVPSCRFFAVVLMDGSSVEPVVMVPHTSDKKP